MKARRRLNETTTNVQPEVTGAHLVSMTSLCRLKRQFFYFPTLVTSLLSSGPSHSVIVETKKGCVAAGTEKTTKQQLFAVLITSHKVATTATNEPTADRFKVSQRKDELSLSVQIAIEAGLTAAQLLGL